MYLYIYTYVFLTQDDKCIQLLSGKLWSTLNETMGRKRNSTLSLNQMALFITKPFDVATVIILMLMIQP
jgi:hypothetical protein